MCGDAVLIFEASTACNYDGFMGRLTLVFLVHEAGNRNTVTHGKGPHPHILNFASALISPGLSLS